MEEGKRRTVPVVPLRGFIVFPDMDVSFDIGRDKSLKTLNEFVLEKDVEMFLASQRDPEWESEGIGDLYEIGVFAKIKQVMNFQGSVRVIMHGTKRGRIISDRSTNSYYAAVVEECEEYGIETKAEESAYIRIMTELYDRFFRLNQKLSPEYFFSTMLLNHADELSDKIAVQLDIPIEEKQRILEMLDVQKRAEAIIETLQSEIDILNIRNDIDGRVKKNMERQQKEYVLREQIRMLHEELGDPEDYDSDADMFRDKISKLKMSDEHKEKMLKEVSRFENMPPSSPESAIIRNYIETVLELPWNKKTKESFNINRAQQILDEDHYGLEEVKERVIEYLAVRKLTNGKNGTILCLVGPPGVGKTSVAKSVARALNRKYVRISLGGIHDESDIRGHRRTYMGSMEGRIMMALKEAKSKNPLMLLDEVDKMGADYKGDPAAALLEVLDSEQNASFRDHYIEIPFDLSQVLFITTANTLDTVSRPLLDRMEIIEIPGYTESERFHIAKQYLIKKSLENNGILPEYMEFTDEAIKEIISYYTREAGVRGLEKQLDKICRKTAKKLLENDFGKITITEHDIKDYLGNRRYHFDLMNEEDQVGIARGLAWTQAGGDTLSIEVNVMPGKGNVELTGKLGEVMKESAMAAISYIRSRCSSLNIEEDFYKTKDIHIHIPEGAVPKDGPSAGITMATALISSLTHRPVKKDVAMTGEITIRGRVLPIGGLKEKSLAAYRAGIKTVIIPGENEPDLEEIPAEIKDEMKFIPVKEMDTVIKTALI